MALALRLRRALAAAATSSSALLRPATNSSWTIPLPLPAVSPRSLWPRLPAGAAGFRSTSAAAAAARGGDYGGEDSKISPDEILFEGCDYNHWLITMEFPDPKPSREEMIETYLQTLAKVVGSYEEAKKRMYAFSTTTYIGFQAVMTEEMSEKFRGLPGVVFILPDSYLYPETKEYGGDKYDNGVITPRPPPVHYSKPSRNDRNRNYRGNYQNNPQQGNYQNYPPQQGNSQNYRPQQGDGRGFAPQQNYAPAGQDGRGFAPQQNYAPAGQDGRGFAPQQNYGPAGQDGRGYGRNDYVDHRAYNTPPGGYQDDRRGPAPQYQGNVNPGGQGQGYYNPPQGPAGDFRPGGPSSPRNYGQSSGTGYPGGNQGVPGYGYNEGYKPGVNSGSGGDNRQGTGPADNWQGAGSGQHPSPGEGQQGNWQGRQ